LYRCLVFWVVVATTQAGIAEVNSSAPKLEVRLQTHLTSYASRPGSRFQCVVISPFEVNGEILIPEGSIVYGTVRRALSVHLGFGRERAAMELSFSEYETPDGLRFPLRAKLVSIDNAREEVNANGRIKGILAAANPDEVLNGIWGRPSLDMFYRPLEGLTGLGQEILEKYPMGPVGPAVMLGVRCFILRFPEPEIHLPPGTDMELLVDQSSSSFAKQPAPPVPDAPAELAEWLRRVPVKVMKPNGAPAGDRINIAFTGSRQELLDAFNASGWYTALPTTFGSFTHVYIAFNGKSKYARAPVSKLLYKGKAPDLVFEKSLDTITKRHHVRIWKAGVVDGQATWLGAATHDTGLEFNRKTFWFTHRIDRRVDDERHKVSIDLTFARCSEPVSYGTRDNVVDEIGPALTDGRIAILSLQPCSASVDTGAQPSPRPPGSKMTRLIRRVVLESRSYILRENVYYWTFEMIRHR